MNEELHVRVAIGKFGSVISVTENFDSTLLGPS